MPGRFRSDLVPLVHQKLAADALPREVPDRTSVGYGNDDPCSLCDHPVSGIDVEHEFEHVLHGTLRFHSDCFTTWRSVALGWPAGSNS
jgi:hypothetical protein